MYRPLCEILARLTNWVVLAKRAWNVSERSVSNAGCGGANHWT